MLFVPTQPHHDIDHVSALKEFTQFITNSTQRSSHEGHVKISTDYPWKCQQLASYISVLKSTNFVLD